MSVQPIVVYVPGPVDREVRCLTVSDLHEYVTKNREHPTYIICEGLLRYETRDTLRHIVVVPDREWLAKLPVTVATPGSEAWRARAVKAESDLARAKALLARVVAVAGELLDVAETESPAQSEGIGAG